MSFNTVCMVGLGYIGLPTAAILASRKINVVGVDNNPNVVKKINQGQIHIVEPDLDILVQGTVNAGFLTAYETPKKADAFIIAVPTPFKGDNHEPNLDHIKSAVTAIAKVLEKGNLIILESTSPVGTTAKMADWLARARPDLSFPQQTGETSDIKIAYCPERVLPGQVIKELVTNDRIVGGMTKSSTISAIELYKIFVDGDCLETNAATAEMSKLTENAFRDVNIAFSNELSLICEEENINVWELISLANRHPRVNILQPGCGVGGHCIAVDPWFIVSAHPKKAKLIKAAREINDYKPEFVVDKIKAAVKDIKNPKIACLGVAFKPNIDDLRESPALKITKKLSDEGNYSIIVVEPNINQLPVVLENRKNTTLLMLDKALEQADIIVILVAHKEFSENKLNSFINIIDFCGAYSY